MKIVHKNSKEEFDASALHSYKHNSVYGTLIVTFDKEVIFFPQYDCEHEYLTDDFEFINN